MRRPTKPAIAQHPWGSFGRVLEQRPLLPPAVITLTKKTLTTPQLKLLGFQPTPSETVGARPLPIPKLETIEVLDPGLPD